MAKIFCQQKTCEHITEDAKSVALTNNHTVFMTCPKLLPTEPTERRSEAAAMRKYCVDGKISSDLER